jgi:adenine deaminase
MQAIQMATINTAEHFRVDDEIGLIAPGRCADILLVRDLSDFRAETVVAGGRVAARDERIEIELPRIEHPEWALRSVHLGGRVRAGSFRLDAPVGRIEVIAHVIGVVENQAPTRHITDRVRVEGGEVRADRRRDIAKIAVLDRHHGNGRVAVALVRGFGFTERCAVASTVAHDCHNLVVVGTSEEDMALAANELSACGGGQIVVRDGTVIGRVALPIAGLMSDKPAAEVAAAAATVLEGFRACGCALNNPNMQLSLLPLAVIPELRLSDLGLIDVKRFEIIDVLE